MKRPGWRLVLIFLPLYVGTIILAIDAMRSPPEYVLQPVQTFGSPLRAGDRVYVFTGQWRSSFHYSKSTDLLVDLWAFDANSAGPLWRRRLETERNGAPGGWSILGADGDTLWLLTPKGPAAASLANGDLLADNASIEARNPSLRGILPRQAKSHWWFDAAGLRLDTDDGRKWRLDGQSFSVRPWETGRSSDAAIVAPAPSPPNGTGGFQERGLAIPGRWLGLLNNGEATELQEKSTVRGLDSRSRRRLWGARTKTAKNVFGTYTAYSYFTPLGRDYLAPGLLSVNGQPILLRNPDSVLILHRDHLGEEGHLQLDRVAGPEGRTLWKSALPLSELQSVMPGGQSLFVSGMLLMPRQKGHRQNSARGGHGMLISIDLSTGALHTHDQSDTSHHPAAAGEAAAPR